MNKVFPFSEKKFQPGSWNNPKKYLGTGNSEFRLGKFPGFDLEIGQISGFHPGTGKHFRVPTNYYIFDQIFLEQGV